MREVRNSRPPAFLGNPNLDLDLDVDLDLDLDLDHSHQGRQLRLFRSASAAHIRESRSMSRFMTEIDPTPFRS